jgi:hypothetical protein
MVQYIRTAEAAFDPMSDTLKGTTHSSEVQTCCNISIIECIHEVLSCQPPCIIFLTTQPAYLFFGSTLSFSLQLLQAPKAVFWLMSFCKYMDISRDVVESCLPSSALAILQSWILLSLEKIRRGFELLAHIFFLCLLFLSFSYKQCSSRLFFWIAFLCVVQNTHIYKRKPGTMQDTKILGVHIIKRLEAYLTQCKLHACSPRLLCML